MTPQLDWPTPDEERQLLVHLATGDPTARETIAVRFHPLLMQYLARRFPRQSPDLYADAAGEAIVGFLPHPPRFDPTRGDLGKYLRMAARGDLLNLLAQERRARRGIPLDSVAEPADRRNPSRDDDATWDDPRLAAEVAAFDPNERATFELLLEGARKTASFVQQLHLGHLPAAQQAAAVKRFKDRVLKRLVRAVEDLR